jgi:hypothetical protein
LSITEDELSEIYDVVVKARAKLRQRINVSRINESINNPTNAGELIQEIPQNNVVKSKKGGAREGAGRPKGSTNRLTAASLLRTIERKAGVPFEELVTDGYLSAIEKNDKNLRFKYETLIIGKVMSTIMEVAPIEALSKEEIENRIAVLLHKEMEEKSVKDNEADE